MAPRVPKALWSSLGPLPVTITEMPEETLGMVEFRKREVTLDKTMGPEARISTMWHEAVHIALYDSGVTNSLTHDLEEAICDAVGAYLAGMMLSGCLTVRAPK